MRFKWRRHLAVTAFALGLMLPLAGCSSQQQQASDEVAAEGQGGEEESGGQQGGETAAAGQQGGGEEAGNATAEAAPSNEAPAGENAGGENVVSNSEAPAADGGSTGDVEEIVKEMNGSAQGQESAEAAPAEEAVAQAEAAPAEAAPAAAAPAASAPIAAAVPGMPEMGSKMAYVVEAGDTLGKIAGKIYGDQKRWRDIANLSGMENPNHIYPGDIVYYSLDDASKNFATAYESVKRAKEVVREGDTLAAISKRVYGTSKAWRHIWRQNDNIDNPDILTAGMAVYYVEKGSFNAASVKAKSLNVAIEAKVVAKKGFKAAEAKTVLKSKANAQTLAVIGTRV